MTALFASIGKNYREGRISTSLIWGLAILALIALFSLIGPLFVDQRDALVGAVLPRQPPSAEFLLGTDAQGRDMLTLLVFATPNTLKMGLLAGFIGVGAGTVLGLVAGNFRGPVDGTIRVVADALMTVPAIAILVVIAGNVQEMTTEVMALVVASLAWMFSTRTIRSQVLTIRERSYIEVARVNGEGAVRDPVPRDHAEPPALHHRELRRDGERGHPRGDRARGARARGAAGDDARQHDLLVAAVGRAPARHVVVVAAADHRDRADLARPVPDLDRLRPLRQPAAEPAMTEMNALARDAPDRAVAAPVLMVEDLEVHYDTPEGPAKAVNRVSFALRPGERLGLIGESGSGKTTMAMALMRLTRPPARIAGGRVSLDGRDLLAMGEAELRQTRLRDIALVPQGAMSSLNPVMRLGDQVVDAIVAHRRGLRRAELAARVAELLRNVGLDPGVAERYPHELSGGMKQRAVMAIATCLAPKVIIADEPTSALDVVVQRQVMQTLGRLQDGLGAAVVLIGHDMGLIAQFADTVGVMYAGRIVEIGPVRQMHRERRGTPTPGC